MFLGILKKSSPYFPTLLYAFGVASSMGMTLAISLFSDLLAVLTVHIYMCYTITNFVYARSLATAGSLWNLFRGMIDRGKITDVG
jgi:phosphatidylinositol N-acetylglucosaminyltransferase subunit Q